MDALYKGGYENVGSRLLQRPGRRPGHPRHHQQHVRRHLYRCGPHQVHLRITAENIKAIQTLHDTDGINFDASINGGEEITLFRNGTLQMAFCWNIAQQLNTDNNDAGLTNSGDEIFPMSIPHRKTAIPKLLRRYLGLWHLRQRR